MSLSACFVCRHAKRANAGQVACRLDGNEHETMHVCCSFVPTWMNEHLTAAGRFSSCSASTTATNSTSDEIRGQV